MAVSGIGCFCLALDLNPDDFFGEDFTATITKPLIKHADCRWISSGVVEFTVGVRTCSLDFGDGTCGRFGTLTLTNGDSYTIRLRR